METVWYDRKMSVAVLVCVHMHCSALICVVLALSLNCTKMDLLKMLMSMGEALGFKGDILRAFVKD